MISVTLSKIADVLGAEHRGADLTLDTVITDTRKVTPGCLFVALKGERFDAHDFADKAKANGAGALLVSRPLDIGDVYKRQFLASAEILCIPQAILTTTSACR